MKKPYIKKYCEIKGFKVWIVDGKYIRDNIDVEFTNFGQHHRFKFIPKNEFWLDKEYGGDDEAPYFIENLLVENICMERGASFYKAWEKGAKKEAKLRKIHEEKKPPEKELIDKLYKRLLKRYSRKKLKIWLVNGRLVRNYFYVDFTEGGHDLVYDFVPNNEVWLDDDLDPREIRITLLHEIAERNLMKEGLAYDPFDPRKAVIKQNKKAKIFKSAHEMANHIEKYFRTNPKGLDEELKKKLKVANSH